MHTKSHERYDYRISYLTGDRVHLVTNVTYEQVVAIARLLAPDGEANVVITKIGTRVRKRMDSW